jgi:hypothetical protein
MSAAKYYIYRNLRTKGFSVRYRGLVIDRPFTFSAEGVEFKVNELGRLRVTKERQKNVHAFVVADKYTTMKYPVTPIDSVDKLARITYNPYTDKQFVCNGKNINRAKEVIFQNGRCFLIE